MNDVKFEVVYFTFTLLPVKFFAACVHKFVHLSIYIMANCFGTDPDAHLKRINAAILASQEQVDLPRKLIAASRDPSVTTSSKKKRSKQTDLFQCYKKKEKSSDTPSDKKSSSVTWSDPVSKSPSQDTAATAPDNSFDDNEEAEFEDEVEEAEFEDEVEEKPTQVLLGQATPNTQDTVFEDDFISPKKAPAKDEDSSDNEVQVVGVKVKGGTVKIKAEGEPIYIEQPLFDNEAFCCSCSNMPDQCHQFLFGEFIVQEVITWLDGKDDDEIVTKSEVMHQMKWHFAAYGVARKYDNNCWHDMPRCLLRGACRLAMDLSNSCVFKNRLCQRREGGAAVRYTKYKSDK